MARQTGDNRRTNARFAAKIRAYEASKLQSSFNAAIRSELEPVHDRIGAFGDDLQNARIVSEVTHEEQPEKSGRTPGSWLGSRPSWPDAFRKVLEDRRFLASHNTFSPSATSFYYTLGVCLSFIVGAGSLLYREVAQINDLSALPYFLASPLAFHEFRTIALGFVIGTLGWFAIKLLNDRYKMLNRREEYLDQYQIDVQRADYIIGVLMDSRRETGDGLPAILLKQFSSGLFGGGDSARPGDGRASDTALQALLSRAASLKLGPAGVEIEVNKAGLRKAVNELKKSEAAEPDE